ncbi:c-type cytochrome [Telmatocola sphagniphila]|uniref:C-type cytochrome n=1 Tax=Telmatocola sphagniphila TaxID=1123043 RepID=A0A8E6B8V6_9BACT|nr:PVC-type heme-binding CxxCH protein [Telmatocola sphagniphila]QVL33584.1 c-type cytochrome [Telmatocola sphagniphila]
MKVPQGFHVTLFAGEPDIVQPIAMCFDDRGRLWVIENLSYPRWSKDGTGKDKVVIFEDTKGEGKFDKRTVFLDNGSNLTGLEIGYGGVWLLSAPNLIFIPIKPGEDKPAGPAVVKLTGWSLEAKHNVVSNLIWGPDGWLYGCNGILATSEVGPPSSFPAGRTKMNCGVWRYHPIQGKFEIVAQGTTNPWGLDWNAEGQMFITNCVIKHLFHVLPGGHYDRMYGQDLMDYVYEPMPSIVDYIHWAGGDWTTSRGGKGEHSDMGGGHAHSGAMVYLGTNWPEEYRGKLYTCNIHGNRINCDKLTKSGSAYKGERQPDFLFANDEWFRGLALKCGPDGGVYVLDWCDTGECHNYEVVDQTNGRIYKVVYGKPKPWVGDLQKEDSLNLISLLQNKNEWLARKAMRLLQERLFSPEREKIEKALTRRAQELLAKNETANLPSDPEFIRPEIALLRYMWVLGRPPVLEAYVTHKSEDVRAWTFRYLIQNDSTVLKDKEYLRLILEEKSPFVRLQILSALKMTGNLDKEILEKYASHSEDVNDPFIPKMLWYTLAESSPSKLIYSEVPDLSKITFPKVQEWYVRYLVQKEGLNAPKLNQLLLAKTSEALKTDNSVSAGLLTGLLGQHDVKAPEAWKAAFARMWSSDSPEVRSNALKLGVIFNEPRAFETLSETLKNPKIPVGERQSALETLADAAKPNSLPLILDLLKEPALRLKAIQSLANFKDNSVPTWIMLYFKQYSPEEQEAAVNTLSSRVEYAQTLLDGLEDKTIPKKLIGVLEIRRLQALKSTELEARLVKVIGSINPPKPNIKQEIERYKSTYTSDFLGKADLKNGHIIFMKSCAVCHQLHGEGQKIGPDLTGSQRTKLDYLLENVLDPSAVVANEYRVKIAVTHAGRVVTGIIKQETPDAFVIQDVNGSVTLAKKDIEELKDSRQSLMPDGLLSNLSTAETRDLFGYLMSPNKP